MIIAKQLYGGLGNNPFNPAMIGYVVLLISFPVQMTSWLPPREIAAAAPDLLDSVRLIFSSHTAGGADITALRLGIDGISRATPLDTFKTSLHAGHSVADTLQATIYRGALAGIGWQWVNLAYGGRRISAVAEDYPLAYSGQLPAEPRRLRNARLAAVARNPRLAADAPALRRHHAGRVLYSH